MAWQETQGRPWTVVGLSVTYCPRRLRHNRLHSLQGVNRKALGWPLKRPAPAICPRLFMREGSLASRSARGALNLHQDTGDRRPLPLQSKKLFLIKSRVSLPGQKHHADFLDPLCTHIRFFGGVYPINKISALVRRKILPLCLCLRKRADGFVKIHGHECITAGAPLAGGEPRRDALDTAFAGLGLFRGLYPTDEVPARDRRKVTPLSLCPRRRSENLAKIRWHSGF